MHELIRRFGSDTVDKAMDDLIDYATRKVEALIRRMPAGRYEFCDYIEDDVVTDIPIRLKVALTIGDGEIHLDFTGSDVQVGSALNVPTAGRVHPFMSIALVNYFATRDRTIPLNAGVLRRVRMTLPEGSVVNPRFPAACGVRYATVLRIYDAVLGALARARWHRRLRRLARLSQDDPGRDARSRGADHRPTVSSDRGFRGPRSLSRRLRRAAGLSGVPARGPGDRARDGTAALRALGRGGRHRRLHGQRDAEPGHRRRAIDSEDRRAGPRARRRAERADAGRRRSRRSLHAAVVPRAGGRPVRPGLARARARRLRCRHRRRPGRRGRDHVAACRPPWRGARTLEPGRGVRFRSRAPRARAPLAVGAPGRVHRDADEAAGALSRLRAPHALRSSRGARRRAPRDAGRPQPTLAGPAGRDRAEMIQRLTPGRTT